MRELTGEELEDYIRVCSVALSKSLLREHLYQDDLPGIGSDKQVSVKASILLTACKFLLDTYERLEAQVDAGEIDLEEIEKIKNVSKKEGMN